MVFVENLVNGVATALGYLLIFGLLTIVMWKLGPKLYGKFLNQIIQGMTARPTTAPEEEHWERCERCGVPSGKLFLYCPWCGAKRQVET